MPAILNCLDEDNQCTVGGSTFSFKPGQLKYFHDAGVAKAIARLKADDGFIMVSEDLEELAHLKDAMLDKVITQEQRAALGEQKKKGVENYCRRLRELIFNATVSLQKDIDMSGAKYDARVHASKYDLQKLETLARYQSSEQDKDQVVLDKFKELEKKVSKTAKG